MKDDKKYLLKNSQLLTLKVPTIDDAKRIIDYLNIIGGESNNLLFGENEFRLNVEQEKNYIEAINNDPNSLMILGIIEDEIVSVGQINSTNRIRIRHNSELAISVKKNYWRLGIGSIMIKELIRFAKEHEFINNISLGVKADNQSAIKMYEKFGFEKIGVHKNYFNINEIFFDKILMQMQI